MPPLYERYCDDITALHGLNLKLDFAGGEAPWCYLITEWGEVPNADKMKHVRLKNGAPFIDGDATIVTQLIKFRQHALAVPKEGKVKTFVGSLKKTKGCQVFMAPFFSLFFADAKKLYTDVTLLSL